jgi:peptide/nickel transport system permease protein
MTGAAMLALVVLLGVVGPFFVADPNAVDLRALRAPPSTDHLLGTDPAGRDVLARVVHAARISLVVGFVSVALQVVLGVALGLVAGFFGGWVDTAVMRLTDAMIALPALLMVLMFVAVVGPSLWGIVVALAITRWTTIARLVRGQVLVVREAEFVQAARALGVGSVRTMVRHVLPNVSAPVIVEASFSVGAAILTEAALSFLGLGIRPPTASWGQMLNQAQSITVLEGMPWFWIPPGIMIALCVLSINFIGDGLRDALDPRSRAAVR